VSLMYSYTAENWDNAWQKCLEVGWPIYVTIGQEGTYKLYPTGYSRVQLPNEIIPGEE
jgi:hypothetical protein